MGPGPAVRFSACGRLLLLVEESGQREHFGSDTRVGSGDAIERSAGIALPTGAPLQNSIKLLLYLCCITYSSAEGELLLDTVSVRQAALLRDDAAWGQVCSYLASLVRECGGPRYGVGVKAGGSVGTGDRLPSSIVLLVLSLFDILKSFPNSVGPSLHNSFPNQTRNTGL